MALNFLKDSGAPLERQRFTWKELVQCPYSKLDDDAFTRVRVILMNGIESEAIRFSHVFARSVEDKVQLALAKVRRVEQHQQTMINWLNPADQSPLETTIGYEQVAIEITAAIAQREPDDYLQQVYRFGMLEDFDHLYRFSALMDRMCGADANNILQSYTDVRPGRPTVSEHRDPADDLREPYDKETAQPTSKLHALTIVSAEHQVHDYYMTIGPLFSDPVARMLYAEIASIEEQHVTQYESMIDPDETWLEQWLLHECNEVYTYWSCYESEPNPRLKTIWERMVGYELGHFHYVMELMKQIEQRDPMELLPEALPDALPFASQRGFIRATLANEIDLRADGTQFVSADREPDRSLRYRDQINASGSPSELVAMGYAFTPGTELSRLAAAMVRH
jgi:hypothetical protein